MATGSEKHVTVDEITDGVNTMSLKEGMFKQGANNFGHIDHFSNSYSKWTSLDRAIFIPAL